MRDGLLGAGQSMCAFASDGKVSSPTHQERPSSWLAQNGFISLSFSSLRHA
jgi:hypothetical protein